MIYGFSKLWVRPNQALPARQPAAAEGDAGHTAHQVLEHLVFGHCLTIHAVVAQGVVNVGDAAADRRCRNL